MADAVDGPHAPHPQKPIVIDPSAVRMAGALLQIDRETYREENRLSVNEGTGRNGSHTIDHADALLAFDF